MSGLTDTIDRLSTKLADVERTRTNLHRDNQRLRSRMFDMSDRIKELTKRNKAAEKAAENLEYRHRRQVGDEVTVLLAKRIENLKYTLMDFVLGRNELAAENKEKSK